MANYLDVAYREGSGLTIDVADAFDVPVIVRSGTKLQPGNRHRKKRIDGAVRPWPNAGHVPESGTYLVPTTWRDVIDAATTVGQDSFPWLKDAPELASAEFLARYAPLMAYLKRAKSESSGHVGYQLEPNLVYQEGAEKTARALFAYRIGMTMAEWACTGLFGLGSTAHAETVSSLPGQGPAWSQMHSQPDLVAYHWRSPEPWLIEAKGNRRLGKTHLSKGACQLSAPGLMIGPHTRVLCGASIEHRVFMTIDVEVVAEDAYTPDPLPSTNNFRPGPGVNDGVLMILARSRMLTYYLLRSLEYGALSVRPVGPGVANAELSRGRVLDRGVLLETDDSTREERALAADRKAYARRAPTSKLDMLTGRVPGTDLTVGMSRRLFAACGNLATEQAQVALELQSSQPDVAASAQSRLFDDDEIEAQRIQKRFAFAELEPVEHTRQRVRNTTREAFETGRQSTWPQLIEAQPEVDTDPRADLLEIATADTYLAIDTDAIR
jgi:hypothetical protein